MLTSEKLSLRLITHLRDKLSLVKATFFSKSGFSLVEITIVLVIIGLIIGVVLKAQDLIENAKTKKFITKFKQWEISYWIHYDRKGRLPGDKDSNGLIGKDFSTDNFKDDMVSLSLAEPPYEGTTSNPTNTITIESTTFYVFFGSDWNMNKNIIILCGHLWCGVNFTADHIKYIEILDRTIDGLSNGTSGRLIGATQPNSWDTARWTAVYTSQINPQEWNTSIRAAVYYLSGVRQ